MASAPLYPSYRSRYLPAWTRARIDALPHRRTAIVIVPAGAIEQHGPHLPVGTDALLGEAWLAAAFPHLPAEAPIYVGPAITYGKSSEHRGFPGTVTLTTRTLSRLLKAIARQVHEFGFGTLAVLNTHGGNSAVLVATLREIQADTGLNAVLLKPAWRPPLDPREAADGFHAGHFETALMLAAAPHLVDMSAAVSEFPIPTGDLNGLRPEGGAATASWMTRDISKTGVMGDATRATAVEGAAWLEAGGRALAAQLLDLAAQVRAKD